jgi:hypothetical protein
MTTDILLTTAGRRMYRVHWTADILDEAERNILAKRPDLDPTSVARRFEMMRQSMPEAMLDPPPAGLVAAMTNHPGDHHVLAAAVSTRAEVIVTENGKHFPPSACIPFGIETRTLDEFICDLVSLNASDVWSSITEMAERRMRPPQSIAAVCDVLETHIPCALVELRRLGFGE